MDGNLEKTCTVGLAARDTIRGSVGLNTTTVPQWQHLQSQIPSQAMPIMPWVLLKWVFSFRVESPHQFIMLNVGTCYGVNILLSGSHVVPCSPMGAQLLGFAPLQPYGVYPWQGYVLLGNGLWPMQVGHWVAAPSTALSKGSFPLLIQLDPSYSIYTVGYTALGAWQGVPQSQCLPDMTGRGLPFQVVFHLITWSTPNL